MSGIRWFAAGALAVASVAGCVLLDPRRGVISVGAESFTTISGTTASHQPKLRLKPASGAARTEIAVLGEGYWNCLRQSPSPSTPPLEPGSSPGRDSAESPGEVSLYWDGLDHLKTVDLSTNATFRTSFEVPASAPLGSHQVVVQCGSARDQASLEFPMYEASAKFEVIPTPVTSTTSPTSTPPTRVPIRGSAGTNEATTIPPSTTIYEPAPTDGDRGINEVAPTTQLTPPSQPAPAAQDVATTPSATPTPPPVVTPVPLVPARTSGSLRWWLLVVLVLILLGVLLSRLARRAREGPEWVRNHVRVIAGATAGSVVEVMESPADGSNRTCVVRITPHTDNSTQVLEEVHT